MFRIDAKWFFLTYPQCPISRADALAQLQHKCRSRPFARYVIGQEMHQDGNLHLHCLLGFDNRFNCTNAAFFDLEGDNVKYHGNYQAAKGPAKVFIYCTKSDTEYLANWKPDSASKVSRAEMAKEIIDGKPLADVVDKYPQMLFGLNRLKADIETYQALKVSYDPLPYWLPNDWGVLLNTRTSTKRRHWWIWSSQPNRGKTTTAKRWAEKWPVHVKGCDFTYWNVAGNEEVLVLDEYNSAGLKWNVLNQMCDGTYEFRVFMGGLRRLFKLRIIVIFSNQPLSAIYPHMNNLLYARFIEKCID